ncbi:unnamed protein product [Gongylonema pulchrum]|uniref:RYDR_ITPR domain-containing protein n=1 Tax=Gongylonema pulchrum TaxID=637853 RepID=A0A183CVJ1_9BILA|nr:unnamed protein product [Gongylonema pulchrum]
MIVNKVGCLKNDLENDNVGELVPVEETNSWVDQLAQLVIHVPPPPAGKDDSADHSGTENFRRMICSMLKSWAASSTIESNELIRKMFNLLLRQYTGVAELMKALSQTYVLHERNLEDVQDFIENLIQVRELLNVQFEAAEEAILKRGLWRLMNNRIFFQHPDLMRLLTVHEDVMSIMMNVLTAQQGAAEHAEHENYDEVATAEALKVQIHVMHPKWLLHAHVSYAIFVELHVKIKKPCSSICHFCWIMQQCFLQGPVCEPNSELIGKGYPDIGWDPVEGERYIDFLRFCVWINGESVEENANLEAIALSEDIRALEASGDRAVLHSGILSEHPHYPSKETESEDYIDLGAATLDFYSSLVDLLAKCAPDKLNIQAGKGDSVRARAILRSLISLDDLGQILSLKIAYK